MPLSWNEIRDRATAFAAEWRCTKDEDADAKSFLDALFEVFGVQRRKVASFEKRVKKLDGRDGYVDMLWKGTLLIEQKSRGKNLARAYQQAIDYFPGLTDDELPRWVLVSDFWHFELRDLDEDLVHAFTLRELPAKIHLFHFIAGYTLHRVREQDPILPAQGQLSRPAGISHPRRRQRPGPGARAVVQHVESQDRIAAALAG